MESTTTQQSQQALPAFNHSTKIRRAASKPQSFPALELVNRPTVPTEQAAYYLLRRPQTLRGWACAETYPAGLRPVRINGRLGWPVDGIRRMLGLSSEWPASTTTKEVRHGI